MTWLQHRSPDLTRQASSVHVGEDEKVGEKVHGEGKGLDNTMDKGKKKTEKTRMGQKQKINYDLVQAHDKYVRGRISGKPNVFFFIRSTTRSKQNPQLHSDKVTVQR